MVLFPMVAFAYTPEQQLQIEALQSKFDKVYASQVDANLALENKIYAYNHTGNVSTVMPESYYKQMSKIQAENQLKLDKIKLEEETALQLLKSGFTEKTNETITTTPPNLGSGIVHEQKKESKNTTTVKFSPKINQPQVALPMVDWQLLFLLHFCLVR